MRKEDEERGILSQCFLPVPDFDSDKSTCTTRPQPMGSDTESAGKNLAEYPEPTRESAPQGEPPPRARLL